jgi:hypothetical protein
LVINQNPPWHFTEGLITKIALSTSGYKRMPKVISVAVVINSKILE